MSTTMTRQEQQEFLAALHVGVLSIADKERGPLTIPLWYAYEPGGELRFVTSRNSRKGQLLRAGCRMSVCVQDEQPPYRSVTVYGTATLEPKVAGLDAEMARHYLGGVGGRAYLQMARSAVEQGPELTIVLTPQRIVSQDFSVDTPAIGRVWLRAKRVLPPAL